MSGVVEGPFSLSFIGTAIQTAITTLETQKVLLPAEAQAKVDIAIKTLSDTSVQLKNLFCPENTWTFPHPPK